MTRLNCPHCLSSIELGLPGPSGGWSCPSCDKAFRSESVETTRHPASVPAPARDIKLPRRLAHYDIVRPLAGGGMGRIVLARDTRLGREVAVRLLPRDGA